MYKYLGLNEFDTCYYMKYSGTTLTRWESLNVKLSNTEAGEVPVK